MTIINECFWIKNEKNRKNRKISNVFEAIPDAFVSHQANLEKTNEFLFFFPTLFPILNDINKGEIR